MKHCRSLSPVLETFVDGELGAERVLEVEEHVEECKLCQERLRLIRSLRLSVRQAVREAAQPSPEFTARVAQALAAEQKREELSSEEREEHRHGTVLPWKVILPVAAAASVTLFVAASKQENSVQDARPQQNDRQASVVSPEQLLEALLNNHASARAPEYTEPALLQQRLEPKVGVPVKLPSLQQYGAMWVGASVVPIRNRSAASLRYNVSGHRVTLYIYDSERLPLRTIPILKPRVVRNAPVFVGTRRGYTIAATERRGVGYAIATDLNSEEGAELVASIH